MENEPLSPRKRFSPLRLWAMSFGCCVGWGAFVMPGTTFLPMAGPLGSSLALVFGALALTLVAANYHFMMQRHPGASGAFAYVRVVFGHDHAFLCTWFLWLIYAAIIWANATAFPLLIRAFVGDVLRFGFHYTLWNYQIYFGEILFTAACLILFGLICLLRNRWAILLNTIFALGLFLGALLLFFGVFQQLQGFSDLTPAFMPKPSPPSQIFKIMALAPWAFVGFEAISHVSGESTGSSKSFLWAMSLGLLSAALVYIIFIAIAATPLPDVLDWHSFADAKHPAEKMVQFPIFLSCQKYLGSTGLALLFVAILGGVATGVIGFSLALSRLTCAVAEEGILPAWFAQRTKRQIPKNALIFIFVVALLVSLLGRTAIGWTVDITTVGATLAYGYISACTFVQARQEKQKIYTVTGLTGLVLSAALCLFMFMPQIWQISSLATESYFIFSVWGVLGFLYFLRVFCADKREIYGRSTLVWLTMLFVIFFSSTMWMRQDVHKGTKDVVIKVSEYYKTQTATEDLQGQEEGAYLERQMERFSQHLIKHSLIQMLIIMLSIGVVFAVYSLLQRRRRMLELEKIKAEEISRSKSVFLSNMSHDIRTPMNAIIGFTELAMTKTDLASVQDYLAKIKLSSNHLLSLINDVLEMSRIESGKVELVLSNVSIPELLHNLNTIIIGQIEAKQQNLDINALNIRHENIVCDKLRLNQILLNLLSNAIKYTQTGGRIDVNVKELDYDDGMASYEISVKDNGMGMSPEFAAHIFEAFEREQTTQVNKIQGTGLGMAITKHLVDLMQGTIRLITEKDQGSEFLLHFRFPVAKAADQKECQAVTPPDIHGYHVLVVDDDYNSCDAITGMLNNLGAHTEWTMSGKEAILRFSDAAKRDDPYGLCVIDWKMPDMSGINVAREITSHCGNQTPAIVLITAYDWQNVKDEALAAGVNAFCNKPVFASELANAIRKALGLPDDHEDKSPLEEKMDFAGKRLLLVDDIEVNREIAQAILTMNGFAVEEAVDGSDAVAKVEAAKAGYYDCVLMDIQMPKMNGYEATQAIRALSDSDKASVPIVAMTANAFEEDKKAALAAGMNGHVAKPINIEILLKLLREILP